MTSVLHLLVVSLCQRQNKHARDLRRMLFSRKLSVRLQWSVSCRSSDQSVHRYTREQRYSLIALATLCARGQALADEICTKHASALRELLGYLGAPTSQVHRARRTLDVLHRSWSERLYHRIPCFVLMILFFQPTLTGWFLKWKAHPTRMLRCKDLV